MRTWYKLNRVVTLDQKAFFMWWRASLKLWWINVQIKDAPYWAGWHHAWTNRYRLITIEKLKPGHCYPEPYPFMFSLDWRSTYKSLWLGWWLVTWRVERWRWHFRVLDLSAEFQPGL